MITDFNSRHHLYHFGPAWNTAFQFIATLDENSADGRHEIDGDDLYAIVMNRETNEMKDSVIEAHRRYIDIHVVISGEECYHYYPLERLVSEVAYDEEADAELFSKDIEATASVRLQTGSFIAFFPQDGHVPMLSPNGQSTSVKKVVVKIAMAALTI